METSDNADGNGLRGTPSIDRQEPKKGCACPRRAALDDSQLHKHEETQRLGPPRYVRPTFRLLSHGPWRQFENGDSGGLFGGMRRRISRTPRLYLKRRVGLFANSAVGNHGRYGEKTDDPEKTRGRQRRTPMNPARQSRDPGKRPVTPQRREGHRDRPPENLCALPVSAVEQSG